MKREKLVSWVESLTEEQLRTVCVNTVEQLILYEDVRFSEDTETPYWVSCGEDLTAPSE